MVEDLKKYLPLVIGLLGIILITVGIVISKSKTPEPEVTLEIGGDEVNGTKTGKEGKIITVDVSGAVEKPGVYQLPYDSRIVDALIPAGGLSANANRDAISKSINLAQKLTDGSKVYFPSISEPETKDQIKGSETVNVNNASLSDLDTLPGIGPITAQKIIDNRPYQNMSELVSKKVLSSSLYAKLKDRLSAY